MDTKVFPSLVNFHQDTADWYHIDMFYDEEEQQRGPIITFITEHHLPVKNPAELGLSGGQLVKAAFDSLAAIEVSLSVDKSTEGRLLYAVDKPYAAEKILDRAFLREAATKLSATEIIVAIPVRDAILICNAQHSSSVALLEQERDRLLSNFSRVRLSRSLFRIQAGSIVEVETPNAHPPSLLEEKFPQGYEQRLTKFLLFGDKYHLQLRISAPEVDAFLSGAFISLVMVIQQHLGQPHFNGTIEVQAAAKKPPKSAATVTAITNFLHNLSTSPLVRAALRKGQQEVQISFLFGEDIQQGEVGKQIVTNLSH